MPQVRAKLPDGSTQTFATMAEAVAAADRMKSGPASASAPKPQGNIVQRGLEWLGDTISNAPDVPGMGALPNALKRGGQALGGQFIGETLAHPIDNAPELMAMAATGGVGGALAKTGMSAARPLVSALMRTASAGAGGTAGAAMRGDSAGDSVIEGAKQAGLQGLLDVPMAAFQRPLKSLSRAVTGGALRPDMATLDQVRNPATNKQFDTYEEAARHFTDRALSIQPTGTPSSSKYAKGLIRAGETDQAAKQARYALDPQIRVPDAEVTPVGLFDRFAEDAANRGLKPTPDVLAKAEQLVDRVLSRSKVIPGAASVTANMPIATPPGRPAEWTLPQLDQLQKGIQDELQDYYKAKAAATMLGTALPDKADAEVLEVLRDQVSRLTSQYAPQIAGQPTVAELNKRIAERIPYEQLANEATMPVWGASAPRLRVATGSTAGGRLPLRVQAFDYLGRKTAAAARPLDSLSKTLPAMGQKSPQLLRLMQALQGNNKPVSSHDRE
jgi:hypothetical protein